MNTLNKISTLVILLIFSSLQSEYNSFEVEANFYSIKKIDTVEIRKNKNKLDIEFYRFHFNVLDDVSVGIPNPEKSNKTIQTGDLESMSKSYGPSPIIRSEYDSVGRLISYKDFGCTICSYFSYGYKLKYDENNNVVEKVKHSLDMNEIFEDKWIRTVEFPFDTKEQIRKKTTILYDEDQNIRLIEIYEYDKLTKRIKLINQ